MPGILDSFNEAGAIEPRKHAMCLHPLVQRIWCFNEAGAIEPRKHRHTTAARYSAGKCFNEAGAIEPRKHGAWCETVALPGDALQ